MYYAVHNLALICVYVHEQSIKHIRDSLNKKARPMLYANCTGRVLAHTAGLISCVPQSVVATPESFSYSFMMAQHFLAHKLVIN